MSEEEIEYNYDIYFRDTRNNRVGVYSHPFPVEFSVCEFYYTDGNGRCDCNRSIFLYKLPFDDKGVLECNSGDNIIVIDKVVEKETGKVFRVVDEEYFEEVSNHEDSE